MPIVIIITDIATERDGHETHRSQIPTHFPLKNGTRRSHEISTATEAAVSQSSGAVWKSRWRSWAPRPYGLCGRKATFEGGSLVRAQELCESRGRRSGVPVPNSPYGLSVDVKQHLTEEVLSELRSCVKVEVGPRPYGLCGRKLKQH